MKTLLRKNFSATLIGTGLYRGSCHVNHEIYMTNKAYKSKSYAKSKAMQMMEEIGNEIFDK